MRKPVYILGLNFAYHELSACLLRDGKLLAAVEEERFSRIKRGKKALVNNPNTLPEKSIVYCLEVAGINLRDVAFIGLSFCPEKRLEQNMLVDSHFVEGDWGSEKGEKMFYELIQTVPSLVSKLAGEDFSEKCIWVPHHICHAGSAYFVSPFKESAILSIDGIGEFTSTWIGQGTKNRMTVIKEISYPNSLGFLWEKFSKYIGFTEYDASKVMGLAGYGNAERFYQTFRKIVTLHSNGEYKIDNDVLRFRVDDFSEIERLFGVPKIDSPAKIGHDHEDIAAALQRITDDVILHLATFAKERTKSDHLCLAGGVVLNCVSNARIMESGLFKSIYVQPAANDAGTALGAAYHIWNEKLDKERGPAMVHPYWGPRYSNKDILAALKEAKVPFYKRSRNIAEEIAEKLAEGNIIGWFQGRMEFGPRALGNRTLLGDPRNAEMKKILNERIKRREPFRPFAPSVLKEHAVEWFVIPKACSSVSADFMIINYDVRKENREKIPAVTHVDGTSRIQLVDKKTNPRYHDLITAFYKKTGIPLVLNTSFNDNEPIVCSPSDAIRTFLRTKMDYLAIGDYVVSKAQKAKIQRATAHAHSSASVH